jgi:lysophospholipid acyltransferase (LPLAT)-like uncharacterized protein
LGWAIHLPSVLAGSAPPREWPAETWGRVIAVYGRWVARSGRVVFEGELPAGGVIAIGWHSTNLIIMGTHAELRPRPYWAFVPPGALGAVMRGCLKGYDMEAVPLPRDGRGNPAAGLKEMARALKEGIAVGIAVDGPHGPARVLRPGALWLARLSGRPLVVIGAAARPALRARWWDHHLIPSPHARIALVYGEPIIIERGTEIDEALATRVTMALQDAEARAWALVKSPPPSKTTGGPTRV